MIPNINGFDHRLLRKTTVLRTFQTPLVFPVTNRNKRYVGLKPVIQMINFHSVHWHYKCTQTSNKGIMLQLSRVSRKTAFCICENKGAVFATHIVQPLNFLNLKFQASYYLLWLYTDTPKTGLLATRLNSSQVIVQTEFLLHFMQSLYTSTSL